MFTKQFRLLLTSAVLFALVFSLLPVQSTLAQGSLPPTPPVRPTVLPPQGGVTQLDFPGQPPQNSSEDVTTAAVTLGEPGLSYRHVKTFGVTGESYLTDGKHLNKPNGLFIDSSNSLYTVEENGHRMLKFNAAGTNTMILGHAGQPWAHDDFIAWPRDVATDSDGNIWVVFNDAAIKEFDSSGNVIQLFPENEPWVQGDDNDRFSNPWGIAFDSSGLMYISDMNNQRVQVYDVSGGAPSYVETIGETGVPHNDNNGFNAPGQIAFDSQDRLYVMDSTNNFRVQRCTKSSGWVCETFFGETEVQGDDLGHLSWAFGITIKNDIVYLADGGNRRILKCTTAGTCSQFAGVNGVQGSDNSHFKWTSDVAVDSLGNVYVSDIDNFRIQKFNSNGVYLKTIGVTGVPYLTDLNHINKPWGIAVNANGDLYAVENSGYRLLKFNSTGTQQWAVGKPGVNGDGNNQLGGSPEGNPAVDASGRVYVPDTNNNRVQIYNANGSYQATLGAGSWGSGNNEFAVPNGVAISPVNGEIYVADMANHRIQVFNSSRVYKATLGESEVSGSDDQHFNWPRGVAVDSSGNIFVADSENHRVQKCNFTSGVIYTCSTFAGETGVAPDGTYNYIHPLSVAVDGVGRVFVADEWDGRVMVYDSNGAFLTNVGTNLGGPSGVAVDKNGNVYIADRDNHRIEKFAPGVPGWAQANLNGFGDKNNWAVNRMTAFNDYLYASTSNSNTGGELWRTADGINWTQVNSDGFGDDSNSALSVGQAFNGYLYAGTTNATGAEIWRCAICDGADWVQVASDGFDDVNNTSVERLVVFSNSLYVTVNNINGVEVWKSSTGDSGSWVQTNPDGFGDVQNTGLWAAAVFNNYLYVATSQWDAFLNTGTQTGIEVWRTNDGTNWDQVSTDGFGDSNNIHSILEPFDGYLYLLTGGGTGSATTEIWRCLVCDGSDWTQVVSNGFGDQNNAAGSFMFGFGGYVYASTSNEITGTEIWRTINGMTWSQVNMDGFGDQNNIDTWSVAVFNNNLFMGTRHGWDGSANSGQVWMWLKPEVMNVNTVADTGDGTLGEAEVVTQPITKLLVTFNKDVKPPKLVDFALKNTVSAITINSLSFDSPTNTVTLNVNGGVKLPSEAYTLTVKKSIAATDNNSMGTDFVRHFNISKAIGAPLPISPANGALTTDYTPRLDWSTTKLPVGTFFDHYRLQVATDDTFASPLVEEDILGVTNSEFTFPSDLDPNTKYYWHVQAWNTAGQEGVWSVLRNFRTALTSPTLASPANAAMVFTLRPTLTWNASPNATGYTVQVSKNDAFTLLLFTANSSGLSYTPTVNLPADKTLHWRVRANGTNGPSSWSASRSFTTGNPPTVPVLVAPLDNKVVTAYTPVLDWKNSTLTIGTFKHYQIQINTSDNFTTPLVDATTAGGDISDSDYASSLIPNTKYYWRVRAVSTIGVEDHFSGWSTVWSIRAASLAPTLLTPLDSATAVSRKPLLDWENVAGNTGYVLQVWKAGTTPVLVKTVTLLPDVSEYQFIANLLPSTNYIWKVQTKSSVAPSTWSQFSFKTGP